MNLPLFIARHIYGNNDDKRKVSKPAIIIATAGVAIGLAVMIITVSIVLGFKHTIRDKVIGFGGHVRIANYMTLSGTEMYPTCVDDSLMKVVKAIPGVSHAQKYAYTQGLLKTDDDFIGISFKGVDQDYDFSFIKQHLTAGAIPNMNTVEGRNSILISQATADALKTKAGDKLYAYFFSNDNVRMRKYTVAGVFQTHMSQFDNNLCFFNLATSVKLNGWEENMCSGIEVAVSDFDNLDIIAQRVGNKVDRMPDSTPGGQGDALMSETIQESYPNIFAWLDLLDLNVMVILILMICVAGFTMISGLLIIILERTQMIGILKALGASNGMIRHTFLWFAAFIIGRGLLWGNIIAFSLIALQQATGFISLDASTYYVSEVPMEINWLACLAINAITLLTSMVVLVGPSYLVSHIHPAKSMRYE
ncbi:MAG: ABC transporter permease [Prevotella sp.]|nr:ABC transporter permease [Prevotella sp.]MDY5125860.1 ABC transporter permease [Prevotella sp.]